MLDKKYAYFGHARVRLTVTAGYLTLVDRNGLCARMVRDAT